MNLKPNKLKLFTQGFFQTIQKWGQKKDQLIQLKLY